IEKTGLDPKQEHSEWNIAHTTILRADIPTIEQVGGDVDQLIGKRATFAATPWKFVHGDACQTRLARYVSRRVFAANQHDWTRLYQPPEHESPTQVTAGRHAGLSNKTASYNRAKFRRLFMGLEIYNLSHEFQQHMPEWPSSPGVNITIDKFHAKDGLYQVNWEGIMHRCTHMDAPIHVTENTPGIDEYPLWRLAGTGVAVSIPKDKWGIITPQDLEEASPSIQKGDIVMINTGFHHKWADCDDYFAYGCGISGAGAQWLVDKKVKCVGYGCQANDHPIATKLVDHGLGPSQPHLIEEYRAYTGRDPKKDFPDWEPAHKTLMADKVSLETGAPSDTRKGDIMTVRNKAGAFSSPQLSDRFNRNITYLRLSITDRCNLRCAYCMPEEGVECRSHNELLTYEELERIAAIFINLGITKIRITGGEPFVRKDCLRLITSLKLIYPSLDLRVTTNGVSLAPHLPYLKSIGINGINLSLDSLNQKRFRQITGRDYLERVRSALIKTLELDIPLKINSVVMDNTGDEEILELSALARTYPLELRFIELMPFSGKQWRRSQNGSEKLRQRLARLFPLLQPEETESPTTTSKFRHLGFSGTIAIIEGKSRNFCASCNKLRITPFGIMKNCLYDNGVLDLRKSLRSGTNDLEITSQIANAVFAKEMNGYLAEQQAATSKEQSMSVIGG
ncbi:unnamed protein product, partial [Cyprideis torosa]